MEVPNIIDEELQLENNESLHEGSGEEDCNEQEVEINIDNNELVKAPEPEMSFNSLDELVEYYKQYGKQEGFGIRKKSTTFSSDGKSKFITLSCSRAGKPLSVKQNRFKPNPATKTECKARVNATLSENGQCRVTSIILDHNHGLSPKKSRFYLCNRGINRSVQRQLELGDRAGIGVKKNYNYFVVEAGGYENVPFLEKDCRNYVDKARRLRLGVGDAEAILHYFRKMQDRNPNFYYSMKMDEDNRMKHVFWADARSRATYEEFGDVVTFDTTYLTNKYDMPFAIFVGVNHHGQSTLLGCGLVSNEDTDAFVWLFRAWVSCMFRQAPNAIITDQDKAMKKAIQIVFPNTRHRWCLWHILKKVPEKLSGYSMYLLIKDALHDVVYDSLTNEAFEENWGKFIVRFNLENNAWLSGLYEERHRWVPGFVKDTFWAGMSTTQRSESMHAFFDGCVNSKTTLKQFVEQYDNALKSKVEKENEADFQSFGSYIPCVTHFEIEKQFQKLYTNKKFKEFQSEMIAKLYCEVSFDKDDARLCEFDVYEGVLVGEWRKKVKFKVYFNEEKREVQCACRLFEFRGILCRHAISIFIKMDVIHAPSKYILLRWRKDLRSRHTRVKVGYDDWSGNPEEIRYDKLHKHFVEVSDLAIVSDKRSMMLHECFNSYKEKLKKIETDHESNLPTSTSEIVTTSCENMGRPCVVAKESSKILDPLSVRRHGRPPKNRKMSKVEKYVEKAKKKNNQEKKGKQVKGSSIIEQAISLAENDVEVPASSILPGTQESINITANTQAYNQQLDVSHPQQFGQPISSQQIGVGYPQHLTTYSFRPPSHDQLFSSTDGDQSIDGKGLT